MNSTIEKDIYAAQCLMSWEKRIGPIKNWRPATILKWYGKYESIKQRLDDSIKNAEWRGDDEEVISQAQLALARLDLFSVAYKLYGNVNEVLENQIVISTHQKAKIIASTPKRQVKSRKKSPKPSLIDIERDRLYDDIRGTCDKLSNNDSSIVKVELQINKWKEVLENTTDISCRQIIKEGLNDCYAMLKKLQKQERAREYIRKDSVQNLLFYDFNEDDKTMFAKANVLWPDQREARTVDGDVLMFFGNGDIYVY